MFALNQPKTIENEKNVEQKKHTHTQKKNAWTNDEEKFQRIDSYILLNESDGINNNMPATTKALVLF